MSVAPTFTAFLTVCILSLPPPFPTSNSLPSYLYTLLYRSTILEKDVPLAAETLTDKLAAGLRSLNSSINGSIMLFNTSPDLCGVTLTIVPLVGIAAMTLRKFTKRLQERSRELQGTVLTFALERYRRIATVRLNGKQEKENHSPKFLVVLTNHYLRLSNLQTHRLPEMFWL